jgi:hypothetical protein
MRVDALSLLGEIMFEQRHLEQAAVIQVGGRPRRLPSPAARRSRTTIASSSLARCSRNSASNLVKSTSRRVYNFTSRYTPGSRLRCVARGGAKRTQTSLRP